jgi:hypothetical protein
MRRVILAVALAGVGLLPIASARAAETPPSPDAALNPPLVELAAADTLELSAGLKGHAFEPEYGITTGVIFADFGMRLAEITLALMPFVPFLLGVEGGGPPPSYLGAAVAVSAGIMLAAPLLNAVVDQAIGNTGRYHRAFGPILLASYASCLTIDIVTVVLAEVGLTELAFPVYFFASLAGSVTMAAVQNAAREPIADDTVSTPAPSARGVAFAF